MKPVSFPQAHPGGGAEGPTKPCPFCGKPILAKALQCVHCRRWMPELAGGRATAWSGSRRHSRGQRTRHLLLLGILTLGFYEFYWFYRNWRDLDAHLRLGIRPGLRTAGLLVPGLNVFLVYDQLRLVAEAAAREGVRVTFSPGWNTAVFFLLAFVSNVTMMWALSLLTVLPLLPVQETLNRYWAGCEPGWPVREEFTAGELVAMLAGAGFLALAVLGGAAGWPS